MAWTITIGGTDRTTRVRRGSVRIQQRAHRTVTTMSFTLEDPTNTLAANPEAIVILTEDGTTRFAGPIRQRLRSHRGPTVSRYYDLTCQDYTSLLSDDVVDTGGVRSVVESDADRIAWLLSTFGTKGITAAGVNEYATSLPEQDFTGLTLHQCLTEIAKFSWARFFVDFDLDLQFTKVGVGTAPFNLSDTPNGTTTFAWLELETEEDTTDLANAILVIGAPEVTTPVWRTDATSIAAYGRREFVINDPELTDQASQEERGDAYLESHKDPAVELTAQIDRPGLVAGQTIQITDSGLGITAQSFTISALTTTFYSQQAGPHYTLTAGRTPRSLVETINASAVLAQSALSAATAAMAAVGEPIADLQIGGANLVPNSSFENSAAGNWDVGAEWVINYASAAPEGTLGSEVARVALTAQTAGDLITPYIPITIADDYWVSAWSNLAPYTSGTARIQVREYNAANTLLATTDVASLTAAQSGWTRHATRFGPNTAYGRTQWQATTAKIRVAVNTAAAATLTWEVDGVQVERGKVLTSYAPSPYELIEGQLVGPEIADGAIASVHIGDDVIQAPHIQAGAIDANKLAASAVVAGKIAAGTITAADIAAAGLTADVLRGGVLTLGGETTEQATLTVLNADGDTIGVWDNTGLYITDPLNPLLKLRLVNGVLSFSIDGGTTWTTALDGEGIRADSITLGTAIGGHNAIPNASMEFATLANLFLANLWPTDTTWATTIGTNVNVTTSGDSLVMTTTAY